MEVEAHPSRCAEQRMDENGIPAKAEYQKEDRFSGLV